jgi:hypothetical protein
LWNYYGNYYGSQGSVISGISFMLYPWLISYLDASIERSFMISIPELSNAFSISLYLWSIPRQHPKGNYCIKCWEKSRYESIMSFLSLGLYMKTEWGSLKHDPWKIECFLEDLFLGSQWSIILGVIDGYLSNAISD